MHAKIPQLYSVLGMNFFHHFTFIFNYSRLRINLPYFPNTALDQFNSIGPQIPDWTTSDHLEAQN